MFRFLKKCLIFILVMLGIALSSFLIMDCIQYHNNSKLESFYDDEADRLTFYSYRNIDVEIDRCPVCSNDLNCKVNITGLRYCPLCNTEFEFIELPPNKSLIQILSERICIFIARFTNKGVENN